ncbi:DUF488 domain-containing protein [Pantoea sp. 1.19]|uniref:DUF488 domain-containing protein n=1 Tax=Pantoea sp. 1.19 TaxID=1925589 RepID=UPI000948A68E|nr:DUF488 family protein [Pantoea sp. 1.19]
MIVLKRAWDAPTASDGYRVLVDRLWPRGESKAKLALDLWLKAVAPSAALRRWFHHQQGTFSQFEQRYLAELRDGDAALALQQLQQIVAQHPVVTLVYAATDTQHNNAVVLKQRLEQEQPDAP